MGAISNSWTSANRQGEELMWEEVLKVSQKVKRGVRRELENLSVIDELSRKPDPINEENFIRKYHQQAKYLINNLGTSIDKFDLAKVNNKPSDRYRKEMETLVKEIEGAIYSLKGELQ